MNTMPLWKRCRVLSSPLRLEILACLKKDFRLCVKDVAQRLGVADEVSCKNLQLLYAAGFLAQQRKGRYLFYSLEESDGLLTEVLNLVSQENAPLDAVIHDLTALTHERRVRIVAALAVCPMELNQLCVRTWISKMAMGRQLDKLVRRGFVQLEGQKYRLLSPDDGLCRKMIELAQKSVTPAQV